jgi:hypothetical protein
MEGDRQRQAGLRYAVAFPAALVAGSIMRAAGAAWWLGLVVAMLLVVLGTRWARRALRE